MRHAEFILCLAYKRKINLIRNFKNITYFSLRLTPLKPLILLAFFKILGRSIS